MANVPDRGDLVKPSAFTGNEGTVIGDDKAFGQGTSVPAQGAPLSNLGFSTDVDATNSLGSVGDTGSDPMFEKFYRENDPSGSNSADVVASDKLSGTDSDPQGQELPNEVNVGGSDSNQPDPD
jgi:hypothetical protein